MLGRVVALNYHEFWTDDIPFIDAVPPSVLLVGHRQVTDAYLLGLATRNEGKLVTFDRAVSALLPPQSTGLEALEVLEG